MKRVYVHLQFPKSSQFAFSLSCLPIIMTTTVQGAHGGKVCFGAVMQLGQQNIRQGNIAVNTMFSPYDEVEAEKTMGMGYESVPNGSIVFQRRHTRLPSAAPHSKRMRMVRFSKPNLVQGTRALPTVFCNLKHVANDEQITCAGVSDTMVEIRGDDWRYRAGRSIIIVTAGIRTVMNSGPEDIYEGEWVFWSRPSKDSKFSAEAGSQMIHRAVLRPVTAENYAADPTCIYRTVGKCVEFSQAGQKLNLSLSPAAAPIPYGKGLIAATAALSSRAKGTPSGASAPVDGKLATAYGQEPRYSPEDEEKLLRKVPQGRNQTQRHQSVASSAVHGALRLPPSAPAPAMRLVPKPSHVDELVDDSDDDQSSTAS